MMPTISFPFNQELAYQAVNAESALIGFDLASGGIIVLDASNSNAAIQASLTAGVNYFIREL